MARLEYVHFAPARVSVEGGKVTWAPIINGTAVAGLPQIFWENAKPWREANLWLMERATSQDVNIKTVVSNASALHAYAAWLEQEAIGWWHFPAPKKDRCLVRYRGILISARDSGDLAPSTASQRMRVVVRFYRWLKSTGLLSTKWPMWEERIVGVALTDSVGFERTLTISTTDMTIPNRNAPGEKLEDGVLPVSAAVRDEILRFAQTHASHEFFLMLSLGFFTGMRLGSICDLKVQTVLNAASDAEAPDLFRLSIGPGASPPVATKFGVTGQAFIPGVLLEQLKTYVYDVVRLKREALATPNNRDRLFLTRFGNGYAQSGSNKSAVVNSEIFRLRKLALAQDVRILRGFRFHQTRATFATQLARLAISTQGAINAVAFVKDALLQKHESTALKYIKFVEKGPVKEALINEFTRAFLGLITPASDAND